MRALGLVVVAAFVFACALILVQRLWERRYRARLAAQWEERAPGPALVEPDLYGRRPRATDTVVPGLIGFFIGSLAVVLCAYLALALEYQALLLLVLGVTLLVVSRLRWRGSGLKNDEADEDQT
ncbi:MAG: hypothetical protein ACRDGB_12245, partial [Candidatus Limnocylindria bacterium]